jgi:T4 RnlA family RNA ligase
MMVKTYDLTYDDCLEIVAYNPFNFKKAENIISGYKVVTFSYFLCKYENFANPLPDRPEVNAFNMRGITFVFNKDGSLFRRYLMLSKFFNLNQVEITQYDVVKDKKINNVTLKEDGSLIAFMSLPNGEIFAKTILGFDNDQSIAANSILSKDLYLKEFVEKFVLNGTTTLFEYVSPSNRVVLEYKDTSLRFIGWRDNERNLEYISASEMKGFDEKIKCVNTLDNSSLEDYMRLAKIEENIEGWVIVFEDGQMIKIKTQWYYDRHGLCTENIYRQDFLIEKYLHEQLDDIVSMFNRTDNKEIFSAIDDVKSAVDNYLVYIDTAVKELIVSLSGEYDGNWKRFAIEQNRNPGFNYLKYHKISGDLYEYKDGVEYENEKMKQLLKKTYMLFNARKFIERWKIK